MKRMANEQSERPWCELRAEAFPTARQKTGFIVCSVVTVVWGVYAIISEPGVLRSPLTGLFVISIFNCLTLAVHAHQQKNALLMIIRKESPELYRKIIIETV